MAHGRNSDPTLLDIPKMAISFLPSQLASISQTPLPYTADPRKLFVADLWLCASKFRHILGIFLPLRIGSQADPWDELYPSFTNIKSVILHIILILIQGFFIISLPFFVITPTFWLLLWIAGFLFASSIMCRLLNGSSLQLEPRQEVLDKLKERGVKDHSNEYWVYLNGVSVGRDWLQSNIDRLSLTFGRKVHGVLNPTDGIVFDLIQCLVQRNLYYATNDIRATYVNIKKALYDENVKKVVFILHSQGGIEGGLIIDWLLAEVPQDILHRMEVYTFGNAANHFNNPKRAAVKADNESFAKTSKAHGATRTPKAIGHIEHYANQGDFVANIGVLQYAAGDPSIRNRFMGRLFISPNSGHLLNQHYLHTMFPIGTDEKCLEHNAFMDAVITVPTVQDEDEERETTGEERDMDGRDITFIGDISSPVSPLNLSSPIASLILEQGATQRPTQVKHLSRLWLYRNGQCPPDDFVRRAATLA